MKESLEVKNSKCEKINYLLDQIKELEKLNDSISSAEYKIRLKVIRRELIQLLISDESCKGLNSRAVNNLYEIIGDLKDRVN